MISPTAFEAHGKEWCEKNPVGTGPFKFVSWERDVAIKYERNPDYWQKGKPYLDKVEFLIIADPMVRLASFESGEIDILERVQAKDIDTLEAKNKYTLVELRWAGLGLNTLIPDSNHPSSPFSNLKVRQAVAHAINNQAIIDSVRHRQGILATQYADPNSWAYNPDVKGYKYDVTKAKQLLAEAGYSSGFECTVYAKTQTDTAQVATAIQGFLQEVGIKANVDLLSETRFNEISGQKGWTNAVNFIGLRGGPDYALLIPRYYGSKPYPSWLESAIRPPEALKALDDAIAARDFKTKQAAMWEAQRVLFDEYLVSLPIYHDIGVLAKYPYVRDDGIYLADGCIWTPEDAWLAK
jgi:peptide/nickel transport system substrate-binding protein